MSSELLLEEEDTQPDLPWGGQMPSSGRDMRSVGKTWGGYSSIGLVRERNEDRFGHEEGIYAVADGMGRLGGGSEASESTLESVFRRSRMLEVGASESQWRTLVRMVNIDVRAKMQELGFVRAGSTLTLVAVEPNGVVVAHVGDSRLYMLQDDVFCQLTVDHNLENELAASGTDIEQAKARGLPMHGLTSYIGQSDRHLRIDVEFWSPDPGTTLLLCTDGVYGCLESALMQEIVSALSPNQAATELTRQADSAGGRDNSTALVLEL